MNVQVGTVSSYARCMGRTGRANSRTEPQWLTPDELATWQALHIAFTALPTALGAQLQADAQVSFIEYYVLAGLSEQPEHTLRMSQLALLANAELSRLSHMIRRLESRGLVRREADPTDGRFTNAILTKEGLAHVKKSAPGHVAEVRRLVFDALDENEQQVLRKALEKVVNQLGGCDAAPPPSTTS